MDRRMRVGATTVASVMLSLIALPTPNGTGTPPADMSVLCAVHLAAGPECLAPESAESRHWQKMRLRDAAVAEAAARWRLTVAGQGAAVPSSGEWSGPRRCLWDVIVVERGVIREVCVGWSR